MARLSLVITLLCMLVLTLTGCAAGPMFKGELDNVLTVTLADGKPRAFANSTWWRLSIGAELREEDAKALADLIRTRYEHEMLLRWLAESAKPTEKTGALTTRAPQR